MRHETVARIAGSRDVLRFEFAAVRRPSITRWRQRMDKVKLTFLLQERLHISIRPGAAKPADVAQQAAKCLRGSSHTNGHKE
jgi:hypothetical protein